MCKAYEEQNFRSNFVCGCTECDHPKPTREEYEKHEVRIYGHVRFSEKVDDQLDSPASSDVASWFVEEDDASTDDGHTEAREENENMSETETMAPPVVHDEPVHEEPEADASEATEDSAESVESAESADSADADGTEDDAEEVPTRARGELESEVKEITDLYVSGKLKLPEDKELTPHYIAKAIEKKFGYAEPPSTGAVAAVLKRWQDYGYAEFGEDPFHFVGVTGEGEERGLAALREETKERRKEERRKEREAKKAALAAEEATEENSTASAEGSDEE